MTTNYELVEKLSSSFLKFLDSANLKKFDYQKLGKLSTKEKLIFIDSYLKPYRNAVDALIIDTIEKNGEKVENFKAEDITKLKRYIEAFIELVI